MQNILLAVAAISLFVTGDVGTAGVLAGLTVFNAAVGLRPGRRCPPEPALQDPSPRDPERDAARGVPGPARTGTRVPDGAGWTAA
jgi:hypothetical protein